MILHCSEQAWFLLFGGSLGFEMNYSQSVYSYSQYNYSQLQSVTKLFSPRVDNQCLAAQMAHRCVTQELVIHSSKGKSLDALEQNRIIGTLWALLFCLDTRTQQDRNWNRSFRSRNSGDGKSCVWFKHHPVQTPFGSRASLISLPGWSGACLGGVGATFMVSLLLWNTTDERPEDQFIKPTAGTP